MIHGFYQFPTGEAGVATGGATSGGGILRPDMENSHHEAAGEQVVQGGVEEKTGGEKSEPAEMREADGGDGIGVS